MLAEGLVFLLIVEFERVHNALEGLSERRGDGVLDVPGDADDDHVRMDDHAEVKTTVMCILNATCLIISL